MTQLSQVAKIVGCFPPTDQTGSTTAGKIVGLQEYNHVTFLVYIGNLAGNMTLTVKKCDNNVPDTAAAIAFNYRKASAGAATHSELDGALTAASTSGITIAAASDDNKIFAIELDADEIGEPYVQVALTSPGAAAALVTIIAILTQPRYAKDIPPSAID
jgi:hypothetical protein